MMRPMAVAAGVMLLLVCAACKREEAQRREREQQRAGRLEQELAKLQAGFASPQPLELTAQKTKNLERLVPEWRDYGETLAACERDLAETMEKVASRRIPEIAPPALRGWRRSTEWFEQALAKGRQVVDHLPEDNSAVFDESMARFQVYNAAARLAAAYSGAFLRPLRLLAQQAPRAERATLFEQLASEHARTGSADVAGVLRGAWAMEDDPVLKARMEQKLKELNLPLMPAGAGAAKGK
jgi:hypothetical protein